MNRLAPDDADARFMRRVLYVLVIVGIAAALLKAGNLLILAFGSMLGAIAIHAIADLYRDHLRMPERAALPLGMATALGIVVFLAWLFGVQFREQVNVLVTRLPGLLDQLAAWARRSAGVRRATRRSCAVSRRPIGSRSRRTCCCATRASSRRRARRSWRSTQSDGVPELLCLQNDQGHDSGIEDDDQHLDIRHHAETLP